MVLGRDSRDGLAWGASPRVKAAPSSSKRSPTGIWRPGPRGTRPGSPPSTTTDAVFSDTMLGLQAQGPAAISELSDKRFGSASKVTFEIIDLYAQTNGYTPPTEQLPENGDIIGVGIHYRCSLVVNGKSTTVEGLTTFELGTRQGKSFATDPNGLITREEVFYEADSLLASGLVR